MESQRIFPFNKTGHLPVSTVVLFSNSYCFYSSRRVQTEPGLLICRHPSGKSSTLVTRDGLKTSAEQKVSLSILDGSGTDDKTIVCGNHEFVLLYSLRV